MKETGDSDTTIASQSTMRFTIIIPCYNRHDELRHAIRSCLDQTFSEFELVVVDDGSPHPLDNVCKEFNDPRIKYTRNPENRGVSACRNIGLDAATGEYISFLDSDDLYFPNRLAILDDCIRTFATPPRILFHRQERILGLGEPGAAVPSRLPKQGERLDDFVFLGGNFIQTNSIAVERQLAKRVRFDEECKIYEDTKFIVECWLTSGEYVARNEVLSQYRDFRVSSRLSKQAGFERLRPALAFTQNRCSQEAHAGFSAHAAAAIPFFQNPGFVLSALWRGLRAGVPRARCAIYLARSLIGTGTVDDFIRLVRRWSIPIGPFIHRDRNQHSSSGSLKF